MEVITKKHIGVYGIIIQNDEIVLVRKANGGYKGKLDLPGGGMEHGEEFIETLKREVMEEVGVLIKDAKLFDVKTNTFTWNMCDTMMENLHHIGILYTINGIENEIKKDPDGLDSLGSDWYKISTLLKDDLTPFALYALNKLNYSIK